MKAVDPDLQKLMERKAETTSPFKLVEEIEALHDGLHDMKAANARLLECLHISKERIHTAIHSLASAKLDGSSIEFITEKLAKVNSDIVIALAVERGEL